MNVVTVVPGWFGAEPSVSVRVGEEVLEIALRGATPLRWLVAVDGHVADVLDGYRDDAELESQDGVRNGIMAPFCNRVADARYRFDGVEHDLRPGSSDRTTYHGLVRELPFVLHDVVADELGARVTFRCDGLAEGLHPGYPYGVQVDVSYLVRTARLDVEITGLNVAATAAPFAAGWHPYFRLPGAPTVDRLHLTLPAGVAIETGPDLVPRPGAAAFSPLPAGSAQWQPIGDAVLDRAFAGLDDSAGPASSVLRDPETGVRLDLWQDRGLVHVFTGDTLARDRRASVAVEPVELMTDAFNRPDCAAALRLEPGQRRTFRFGARVSVGRNDT